MTTFHKINTGREERLSVNFDCPWCDARQAAGALLVTVRPDEEVWLASVCTSVPCGRPILVRIAMKGGLPWSHLYTDNPGSEAFYDPPDVYPASRPDYAEDGVPEAIQRDFQEALQCQAAGFKFGAALVGRRALQAAVRDRGGTGRNLKLEIDSLPTDVLNAPLKSSAHDVRHVGNDAAHADEVEEEDVEALLGFTRDVLHSLYVVPHRVANRPKRPEKKK